MTKEELTLSMLTARPPEAIIQDNGEATVILHVPISQARGLLVVSCREGRSYDPIGRAANDFISSLESVVHEIDPEFDALEFVPKVDAAWKEIDARQKHLLSLPEDVRLAVLQQEFTNKHYPKSRGNEDPVR